MQTGVHPAPGGPWALVLSPAHAPGPGDGSRLLLREPCQASEDTRVPLRAQDAGLRPGSCMNGSHGAACGDHRALPQLVPGAHVPRPARRRSGLCSQLTGASVPTPTVSDDVILIP